MLVQGVASAIVRNPKPVIAEVHGWTVGAGLEWMLDADITIAADTTCFKLPEASLGVFVTGGLSATLPAMVAQFKRVFNETGLAAFDRAIDEENRAQRALAPR